MEMNVSHELQELETDGGPVSRNGDANWGGFDWVSNRWTSS